MDDAEGSGPPELPRGPARFQVQNRQRGFAVDAGGLARFLGRIADDVAPADPRGATLRIVSDRTMRELNRTFRGFDRATDVLAFPAEPADAPANDPYLGDMTIAADTAARQAEQHGCSLDAELRVLSLHGLLHLFGWDHERDRGEMRRLEALLRKRHGLAARSGSAL